MPAEPTSVTIAIATLSAFTLSLLGVDYYSLLWALIGALLALYQSEPMRKWRTMWFIALSTLVGAACGTGGYEVVASNSRPVLIVLSLVAGYGAQLIVTALLGAGVKRIEKLGGD